MFRKIKNLFNKYYHKDIQYFISTGKYKLIYEIISFAFGFVISIIFANLTTSDFYGSYLFILSIVSFFSFLTFSGILSSVYQSIANGYENFYISGIKKIFKLSFLSTFAISGFALFYFSFIEENYVIFVSLLILSAFVPFSLRYRAYHYYLDGKQLFKRDFQYRLLILTLQESLLIILIFIIQNVILYFIVYNSLSLIINYLITKACIRNITSAIEPEREKAAFNYGFFLTKISILALITSNINNVIIGLVFSPATLAFYIIGINLPNKLLNAIKPTFSTLLAKYSKEGTKIGKTFLGFTIIVSVLLFLGVILILPTFIIIFYPKYTSSIPFGILFSFILLFQPTALIFGYYFRGKADKKAIRFNDITSNLFKLVFLVPFTIFFGIYGLILIDIFQMILRDILYIISLRRRRNDKIKEKNH